MLKNLHNENNFNPGTIGNHRRQGAHKKGVATLHCSNLLHFIVEHGFGLFLSVSLALCGALMFVFGLFLASGWSIVLGIGAGYISYLLFTSKDYDKHSIKEALETLVAGKEVSK